MPLFGSILPFGNKLAYPSGRAPGFDPTHPAANGISVGHGFSAVSVGANLVSLLSGKPGSIITAGPSAVFDARLGPTTSFVSGGELDFGSQSTTNDAVATMAAIVNLNSAANGGCIFCTSNGASGYDFGIISTTVFHVYILPAFSSASSGISLLTGVPYFLAASLKSGASNFVVLRLDNGKLQTATDTATTFSSSAPSGTLAVGAPDGQDSAIKALVAAVMWTPHYLSMLQLVAFAGDPWGFWYPRKTPTDWVGKIAAAGALFPFVRRNIIRASAKGFR